MTRLISSPWTLGALLAASVGGGACRRGVDPLHRGVFVLLNESGVDATLTVYHTADRRRPPLTLLLPQGGRVERAAQGDPGGFAYPELFF